MEKLGTFYTDNSNFIFIPNDIVSLKIFGNKKTKNGISVLYIQKFKTNWNICVKTINVVDLAISGFKEVKIKEVPKKIIGLLKLEIE